MSDVREAGDVREAPAKASVQAGPVFRLIYRSHSRIPDAAEAEELGRILSGSRTRNAAAGVTGALMIYDHWFAQALEGPRDAVLALFERIKADARHDTVEIREEGDVPERAFARWAMAHVGEHGQPDIALTSGRQGVVEAAAWRLTEGQDRVVMTLRDLTRGYGIGA